MSAKPASESEGSVQALNHTRCDCQSFPFSSLPVVTNALEPEGVLPEKLGGGVRPTSQNQPYL